MAGDEQGREKGERVAVPMRGLKAIRFLKTGQPPKKETRSQEHQTPLESENLP